MSSAVTASSCRKIIIVGGGPIGWATAVHLGRQGLGSVTAVVERDASYKYCSALLSAGGIRQQYSLPENIHMSLYSHDFMTSYLNDNPQLQQLQQHSLSSTTPTPPVADIALKPYGYMFLGSSPKQAQILKDNHHTQQACGVDWIRLVEHSNKDELTRRYPWLYTEDLVVATYSGQDTGTKEGYFDPWGFMQCMKHEAVNYHGVQFIEGQVAKMSCVPQTDGASDPWLRIESLQLKHGKHGYSRGGDSITEEIKDIETVINCTGAWTKEFVRETICKPNQSILRPEQQSAILNVLPIERRKRCIFFIHCPGKHAFSHPVPPTNTPLTIDPTGVYFRSEGTAPGSFICGVSPESHLDDNYNHDDVLEKVDYHLFEDIIWPTLAHRVPAFNELKVKSAWSGFYDYNTFDQNGIIGYHPHFSNFICAGGFSGHGLQMAPATGRAVTELLLHNQFQTLDLSSFSFERLLTQTPYLETGIV